MLEISVCSPALLRSHYPYFGAHRG